MSFCAQIITRNSVNPLWIIEHGSIFDKEKLVARIAPFQSALARSRLIITPKTDADLIEMLCALDGIAEKVLIAHPEMSPSDIGLISNGFEHELVI